MNQAQIHPALRQSALSSPPNRRTSSPYPPDGPQPAYASIQGQQQQQQHTPSAATAGSSYHTTPSYYSTSQPAQDSPEEQSPGTNPSDPNDLKRPRACEACRSLKVKCEPDESSPEGSCKRCAKARRQCVVTVPSRKRQKKTDSRVAELEKKIDALTATLAARGSVDSDITLDPAIVHEHSRERSASYENWQAQGPGSTHGHGNVAGIKRKPSDGNDYFTGDMAKAAAAAKFKSTPPVPQFSAPAQDHAPRGESSNPPYVDVIERGVIDWNSAHRCFDRYVDEMCHILPLVVFSPSVTADEVRKSKPILFLAILSVSAGTIRPEVQSKLITEVTKILAERIVVGAEKSMELVQTIQVLTVFYQPPERYEELNFNQLTHMAAVMALDIGMGKRTKKGAVPMWNRYLERTKWLPDPAVAETRRCWLGIYYMCSNSAMSLRRPLLIRWSSYADECIQVLDTAKDALPSDRWLCHLVKAQHLGEDIGVEFGMDDPASVLSITDLKTQRHLRAFEQQMALWREAGGDMMENPVMKHTEAIVNLYMHEIAMHHNHNIDDFRPPFYTTPIDGPPDPEQITPAHIESLTACLRAAHSAFEAFLSMDIKMLRAFPTHFYVRTSYAAVALIKLYSSVATKGSKFSAIFKPEDLRVDEYLDRMIHRLQTVGEGGSSRVALKFCNIFTMLKNWHAKRTDGPPGSNPPGQPVPPDGGASRPPGFAPNHVNGAMAGPPTTWSAQNRTAMDLDGNSTGSGAHGPQTGLHMLSEAAMGGPGRPMPAQAQQGQWISPQQQMGQMQTMPPPGMAGPMGMRHGSNPDFAMMAPYNDNQMAMNFAPDEFMGLGFTLADEWVGMGFNPQWAM